MAAGGGAAGDSMMGDNPVGRISRPTRALGDISDGAGCIAAGGDTTADEVAAAAADVESSSNSTFGYEECLACELITFPEQDDQKKPLFRKRTHSPSTT